MSISKKKSVVLSRFLCYLTIINDKLGDDERHYECSKYNLPFINKRTKFNQISNIFSVIIVISH